MLKLIENWFAPVTAVENYRRSDYVVLGLILAAGVILRFWGLGNVGLHGDEETMAMPAMAILNTGEPILPSGMYYARALLNIYLMSGSVLIFGESEWAFRLPSAIVGSFTGLAAFFMGRRFLNPQFNLAFVATIVFLPSMIEISQTARMYVFFVTFTIWFGACLFRWERDQRYSSLLLSIFVWVLCLHFHRLAIFAAPLFLFPGLSRKSWLQLIQGGVTFVSAMLFFDFYGKWVGSKYPKTGERPPQPDVETAQSALDVLTTSSSWLFGASLLLVAFSAVVVSFRAFTREDWSRIVPVLLVGLGLLAMTVLHYHIGAILLLFGIIIWLREASLSRSWLLAPVLLAGVMTAAHLGVLHESGAYPGRKLIGALIGTPSVWPTFRFLVYSPVAGGLYGLVLLFALARFVKGQRLPMHFLFFAMAVWVPLFLIGYFLWYIPPRYAQGQIGYFLLCAFAGFAYLARELQWMEGSRLSRPAIVGLIMISVAIINPVVLSRTVNPGYDRHPDHKGAAKFIQSLDLSDDTILIAEDVLQQTYYLGHVDYSLRPTADAQRFSILRGGRVIDQYTGAEVLGSGAEFEELLKQNADREVYVIGSGENFVGKERPLRRNGIKEVLESEKLRVVYEGRDGKTKIWKSVR